MQRYHFPLQRVLDVKGIMLEQRERELYQATIRVQQEDREIQETFVRLRHHQEARRRHMSPTVPEMAVYARYFAWTRTQIERRRVRLEKARQDRERRLRTLNAAYREREVLRRLRRRHRENYRREWNREEQKLMDESANASRMLPSLMAVPRVW